MKLSVTIITYNEEINLERTLNAIHDWVDEIIIVDSNSTDNTMAIAKRYSKVKFFSHKFLGDGPQKQLAIDKATGDWILLIDADEVVTEGLKNRIKNIVYENKGKLDVYKIRLVSIINNKQVNFGGWSNVYKKILFKKTAGKINPVKVHASLITDKKIGTINEHLNHHLYKDVFHQIEKLNTYSTEQALVNFNAGKRIWMLKVVFYPSYHFFKMYVLRLGFLDGLTGFYLATVNYFYAFSKYYKLYLLQKSKSS